MTATPAGARALRMYRVTRRRRRKRTAAAVALLAAAVAAGAVAAATHGLPLAVSVAVPLALAAAALVCAASTRVGTVRDADRWRRGAEGERRTADLLDALPSRRWAVWHDLRVPHSRANIDHLVVGRTGVWVVDTKSPRGQVRAGWRSVRLGAKGTQLDTGPVRWEAETVARHLSEALGRRLPVRPIVAVQAPSGRAGGEEEGPTALAARGRRGVRGPTALAARGPRGVRVGGVRVVAADQLAARIRRGRRRLSRADRRVVCRAVEAALV